MEYAFPANAHLLDERVAPFGADGLNESRADNVIAGARSLSPVERAIRRPGMAIIILNLDKPELIVPLLDSMADHQRLFAERGLGFEVVVGDTGSTAPAVLKAYDRQAAWVRIVRGLAYQFSRSNNQTFATGVACDQVVFMNNDVIVSHARTCLIDLYQRMADDPRLGAQGPVLRFADGRIQHAGIDLFRSGPLRLFCYHPHAREEWQGDPGWTRCVPAVTGAFLHMRSDLFMELGGFDEIYNAECQDADLCHQIRRAGYRVEVVDIGIILHLENATRPKGEEHWEDRRILMRRWSSFLSAEVE